MRQLIDLSHDQSITDWHKIKAYGVDAVWCKATEGVTVKDITFGANVSNAADVGIPAYAYHFYRPLDGGVEQATNFLSRAGGFSPIQRVAVDLENCPSNGSDQWSGVPEQIRYEELEAFCDSIIQTGLELKVYTSTQFIKQFLPSAHFLGQYGLWLAHYSDTAGLVPPMWNEWEYWQYSEKGTVDGIIGDVDLSWIADTVKI